MQTTLFLTMVLMAVGQVVAPENAKSKEPAAARPQAEFSIEENSPAGTAVGTVTSTKAGKKAQLSYAMTPGIARSVFAIDAQTGRITVKSGAKLDFETRRSYVLVVTVSKKTSEDVDGLGGEFAKELLKSGIDVGSQIDEKQVVERQSVTIKLTDVNEPPVIEAQRLSVPENSGAGTAVGRVSAHDPDAEDTITYLFKEDNLLTPFAIDRVTGEITVRDGATLDFESHPRFRLNVVARDRAGTAASETVVLELSNVNEPPQIGSQEFNIEENSLAGTVVGRIAGTDADADDSLSYKFIEGNDDGIFILDEASGEITVREQAALDFEGKRIWWLKVQVADAAELSETANVRIGLTDANDLPVAGEQSFSLPKETRQGTVIGQFSATDPDQKDILTYAITGGNEDGAFAIDAQSGTLTVADLEKLNTRTERTANIEVTVTDRHSATTATAQIDLGTAPADRSIIAAINGQKSQGPDSSPTAAPPQGSGNTGHSAKRGTLLGVIGLGIGLFVWGGLLVFVSLRLRRQASQHRESLAAAEMDQQIMRDRLQELDDFCNELSTERDELMATRQLLTHEFEKLKSLLGQQTAELESTGTSLQHSDELLQKQLVSPAVSADGSAATTAQPERLGDTLQSVRREFAERQQRLGELKNRLAQRDRELVETCARMDARLEEVLQKTRELEIPDAGAAETPSVSEQDRLESEPAASTGSDWEARQAQIEQLERQFENSGSGAASAEEAAEKAPHVESPTSTDLGETLTDEEPLSEDLQDKWAARTELNSLRQVANQSARSALSKYSRKKVLKSNIVLGVLAIISIGLSVVLLTGGLGARVSQATIGWGALGIGGIAIISLAKSFFQKP